MVKKRRRKGTVGEEIRVQVPLPAATVERLDELADRFEVSRGRMAASLVDMALDDHRWLLNALSSKVMKPITAAIRRWNEGEEDGA